MDKIIKISLIFSLLFINSFLLTNFAFAKYKCGQSGTAIYETIADCASTGCAESNCLSTSDIPSGAVPLTNPLTGNTTSEGIPVLLGKIIQNILGVIGSLALVMFIYGGVIWMLSGGNQEQVTKGKNILIWATVGIVIIFAAYAIVNFVLTTLTGATTAA